MLVTDEAHAGQMAPRDALMANRREEVIALDESARPAADDLWSRFSATSRRDQARRWASPSGGRGEVLRPLVQFA